MSGLARIWDKTRKIVAIGRNYADHAKELGNAIPKKPVVFLKPSSSIIVQGDKIEIPRTVKDLHHEVELAVVIGKKGRDIPEDKAMDYVSGYAVSLDMTARDVQDEAKTKGLPWSEAKGYDTFCAMGSFIPKNKMPAINDLNLWLKIDGKMKQNGNTKDMIFNVPYLISYVSQIFTLEEGDIILTGTPAGVGPVKAGSTITAGITNHTEIEFPVIARVYSSL